jgi:hypothetical protein
VSFIVIGIPDDEQSPKTPIFLGVIHQHQNPLEQWFSTFVRKRPGELFFIRRGPGIIDARARSLRNDALEFT